MKKLLIKNCYDCPHNGSRNNSKRPSYVPICILAKRKALPYTLLEVNNKLYARCLPIPPDWCPLPDDNT